MTFILDDRVLPELLILASIIAAGMLLAVVAGRLYFGWSRWKQRRFTHRYAHTIQQALQGDQEAIRVLARSPSRDRGPIAQALILPLISDRSQELLARTTAVLGAMDVRTDADRLSAAACGGAAPWPCVRSACCSGETARPRSSPPSTTRTPTSAAPRSTRSPTCAILPRSRRSWSGCRMRRCTAAGGSRP